MIKKILYFTLVLLTSLQLDESNDDLIKFIFKNEKVCVYKTHQTNIFKGNWDKILGNYLCQDSIVMLSKTVSCKRNYDGKKIRISAYPILDIYYNSSFAAEKSYNNMYKHIELHDPWPVINFIKPGKIFCLNKKRKQLRIISANSCSNPNNITKIVDYLKVYNNKYDEIFYVMCGGGGLTRLK